MAKGLCQAGPGVSEDPGRGMLGWQAHFWSPVNQLDHSILSWEMKMPACAYTVTLWPISVQQNFLLWSIKSALCGGTPTERISSLGGTLRDPTVQTASPFGAHNGPSQERALTNHLGGKTNLFNTDIAFPQQTLPYIFLRIAIMSLRLWNQIWESWLNKFLSAWSRKQRPRKFIGYPSSNRHSLFLSPLSLPPSGHHISSECPLGTRHCTRANGKGRQMSPRPTPFGVMKVQCA